MPFGWTGFCGGHFREPAPTQVGRPRRDRRAVKDARRARRHNRRR